MPNPSFQRFGEKNGRWLGGVTKDKTHRLEMQIKYRHRIGMSERYREEIKGHPKKYHRQKRKAMLKGGGDLPIERIQQVYEDNIKRFGTLTCYLCFVPIEFGKDNLEHKIPLFRGGTNEYNNLAIAHKSCNSKKYIRTEEEYRKEFCQNELLTTGAGRSV